MPQASGQVGIEAIEMATLFVCGSKSDRKVTRFVSSGRAACSAWIFWKCWLARSTREAQPSREWTMTYPWGPMDEKEPTQRTEQGHEIPVPTREQVESDFAKIISPVPPEPKKKRRGRRTK